MSLAEAAAEAAWAAADELLDEAVWLELDDPREVALLDMELVVLVELPLPPLPAPYMSSCCCIAAAWSMAVGSDP